jgi:hypothetical protein
VDKLVAVSPSEMTAQRTIALPGAGDSDVTAGADGSTLIVSEAISGAGTVQQRDPVTGALLGSIPMAGVVARVEGSNGIRVELRDGDLWVTDQGGGPSRN